MFSVSHIFLKMSKYIRKMYDFCKKKNLNRLAYGAFQVSSEKHDLFINSFQSVWRTISLFTKRNMFKSERTRIIPRHSICPYFWDEALCALFALSGLLCSSLSPNLINVEMKKATGMRAMVRMVWMACLNTVLKQRSQSLFYALKSTTENSSS